MPGRAAAQAERGRALRCRPPGAVVDGSTGACVSPLWASHVTLSCYPPVRSLGTKNRGSANRGKTAARPCPEGLREQCCDRLSGAGRTGGAIRAESGLRRHAEGMQQGGAEVLGRNGVIFHVSADSVGS